MKRFNCGEKGHPAKACPDNTEKEESDPPMAGMILLRCYSTTEPNCLQEFYEVCIDDGSQVNIVNARLLTGLHSSCKGYRNMNGTSKTKRVGNLVSLKVRCMMTAQPVSSVWLTWRTYTQLYMYTVKAAPYTWKTEMLYF